MAIVLPAPTFPNLASLPDLFRDVWRSLAYGSLDRIYRRAPVVRFGDSSRLVFFSDSHRGDNSRADAFRPNANLFNRALAHYNARGFTYVEVGDGDELWQNGRFDDVRRAHGATFHLLKQFDRAGRLHLLLGNHDIQGDRREARKGDLVARESLVLQHASTGQRIFVLHGHQADCSAEQMQAISRLVVRRVWKRLLLLGFGEAHPRPRSTPVRPSPLQRVAEWLRAEFVERLLEWAATRQRPLICGHTHRLAMAAPGEVPYFNTGNCVEPGRITGIEIQHGAISQVQWVFRSGEPGQGLGGIERQVLTPPTPLKRYR